MSELFLGVDVGGTTIKFAVGDYDGKLVREESLPTESHEAPEKVLKRICDRILTLSKETGAQLKTIGMGFPGMVDVHQGFTRYLPNMTTHWINVPVGKIINQQIGSEVLLLNDVRMATYGELVYGHGRSVDNMMFMAVGTGVGGGIVIDGKLRLGPLGAAGELGHQTVDPNGPLCGCGNYGCLETLASGTALASEGIRLMKMGMAPALHELVDGDPGRVTAEVIGDVAEKDTAVKDAILKAASYLAVGVINVVVMIHPELVVIGGGVANLGELLLQRMRDDLRSHVGRLFPVDNILVEKSQLGSKAGVMGAIALSSRGLPK
ncbi:ROK family protein [Planctomicrobium sp. SH668]|uniref:ROK family protein n=1 Tax=Planctomicrobium sp. SH668 TaxID=3448126 RepID=UPI003F5C948B